MRPHLARSLTALTLIFTACGDQPVEQPPPLEDPIALGQRYVRDRVARRAALERSLVRRDNGYAGLRLSSYALPAGGWDALPVWDPPALPMTVEALGQPDAWFAQQPLTSLGDDLDWSHEGLMALGREAFERYPLQVEPALAGALISRASAGAAGLWIDAREHVGGVVRLRQPDGQMSVGLTCASCHGSTRDDGALVHGRTNARFNLGALRADRDGLEQERGWGPGRVDVTNDQRDNPVAITDLRPIRHQRRLQWAATLHNDLEILAVRVETLIITSLGQRARPPREVSFALAYYLWQLGAPPEAGAPLDEVETRGEATFTTHCSACHGADGSAGEPVALELIGTDPAVGLSSERGTGAYRVPSLWLVGDRAQYFHTAGVTSLEDLLDPERLTHTPGHPFGLNLSDEERVALIAFLRTIGRR